MAISHLGRNKDFKLLQEALNEEMADCITRLAEAPGEDRERTDAIIREIAGISYLDKFLSLRERIGHAAEKIAVARKWITN